MSFVVAPGTAPRSAAWPRTRRSWRGAARCALPTPEQLRALSPPVLWDNARAAWRTWRAGVGEHAALAWRAGRCALVGYSLGMPESVASEARQDAALLSRTLLANVFYAGSLSLADTDIVFHTDGLALLVRDLRRWGGLLLQPDAGLSRRALERKQLLLADIRALLPFSLIVANTFPMTPVMLRGAVLGETSWLRGLRKGVLPSAWEEARLQLVAKARQRSDRQREREERSR